MEDAFGCLDGEVYRHAEFYAYGLSALFAGRPFRGFADDAQYLVRKGFIGRFEYFGVANDLVSETDNAKVKGFVAASTGRAYEKFGEPQEALKSYSNAVKNYTEAESPLKVAQYYVSAADIMIDYNSMDKARGLLKKAQKFAQKTEDSNLINEINDRLSQIA